MTKSIEILHHNKPVNENDNVSMVVESSHPYQPLAKINQFKVSGLVFFNMFLMGTGQNCTKTKLHENKIARRYFCIKTNLHEGTKLHEGQFCTKGQFARLTFLHENKKKLENKLIKKQKEKKVTDRR